MRFTGILHPTLSPRPGNTLSDQAHAATHTCNILREEGRQAEFLIPYQHHDVYVATDDDGVTLKQRRKATRPSPFEGPMDAAQAFFEENRSRVVETIVFKPADKA